MKRILLLLGITYKSCLINDTKYNNIKVHRTYSKYKKNAVIPEKEVFSTKSNYCTDVDHSTGNLLIYFILLILKENAKCCISFT